jgi:hypothetical protein
MAHKNKKELWQAPYPQILTSRENKDISPCAMVGAKLALFFIKSSQ